MQHRGAGCAEHNRVLQLGYALLRYNAGVID